MKSVLCALLLMFVAVVAFAMEIPFSSVPVKSDTNLVTNLVRIDPDDKKEETLPTQAWLWHDEENFYAQVESVIDSTFMPGSFAQRDLDAKGDYLFLNIITNPQTKYAYHFSATPSGSLAEGTKDINQGSSYDWNSSYTYTTNQNDTLWTAVFKVPFKDLRFNANPPYNWKFTLSRFHEKNREYYAVPYYKESNSKDFYDKAIDITLTHKIKGKQDWKFRPYFIKSYDLVNKTGTFDPENVGLDFSFNPSTKTKLKVALNPDFTDVPPDDASNIYNDKYPPYYYENRFFFIEDIDAFGVGSDILYTRNIVQPQFAVKFTGSQDTWNYGYLSAKDKKISEDGEIINTDDFYQLLAVKKQAARYTVHTAFASRMNKGYYNHAAIGDWDYEFIPKMHIGTFHIFSIKKQEGDTDTEEIDKKGLYQWVYLDLNPGNWNIYSSYSNLQKDVALDMGYLYETGLETYSITTTWTSDPKEKYVRSVHFFVYGSYANWLKPNRPLSELNGSSFVMVSFLPKYYGLFSVGRSRKFNINKEHDTYGMDTTWGWSKYPAFRPSLTVGGGKTLIYSLNETKDYYYFRGSFSGNVKRNLSWSASLTHYDYGYNNINYIYTPTDTLIFRLDNSYQIANAALNYNFSNQITTTTGLGITTYKAGSRIPNLTFYSNFRYEFKKDWFLYLGYKTGQSQDEPSVQEDWLGHFRRNSASAYLKLSATI